MPSNRKAFLSGGPAIQSKPKLALPQEVKVSDEGELVSLQFGNVVHQMHYQAALQISQWIRVHAKRAKMRAGDTSRHWSVLGTLDGTPGEGLDK